MAQLKPIERQGIVTETMTRIRLAIIKGTFPPGSTIDQGVLASELGVSRAPIREALLLLERERLVVLQPRRSPRVAPIDATFLEAAFDFWMRVDGEVAAMLADRQDRDWRGISRLIANGRQTMRANRVRLDATQAFHTMLYEATGNSVLPGVMEPIWNHIARVSEILMAKSPITPERELRLSKGRREDALWREHQLILDAIRQGRVARARTLAQSHVRRTRDEVMAALRNGQPN